MDGRQICGTCYFHVVDPDSEDDWICVCPTSEYFMDWTTYGDTCDDWESRDEYEVD